MKHTPDQPSHPPLLSIKITRLSPLQGRLLGIAPGFTPALADVAIALSGGCDAGVAASAARIKAALSREEDAFWATLAKGQRLLDERLAAAAEAAPPGQRILSGADAFPLYDRLGFPPELTQELAAPGGVETDTVVASQR